MVEIVWVLAVLAVLAVAFCVYWASLPASYRVSRNITIDRPIDEVYAFFLDFSNWSRWSPWYLHEPSCKVSFQNATQSPGGRYEWDGKMIGAGVITHAGTVVNEYILQDLRFLRPFKAKADVRFDFKATGASQTSVVWSTQSRLPWLMRPFCKFFERMIGRDFDLGLAFARGVMDPKSEHPRLSFGGITAIAPQTYLSQSFTGSLGGMREAMRTGYPSLWDAARRDPSRLSDAPAVAAYDKVKPQKEWVKMRMGVAVTRLNGAEEGFTTEGGRYFETTLQGNYCFLEGAWHAAMAQAKMRKYKIDKARPALEVYVVNPMQAQEAQDSHAWTTKLLVPIQVS